MSPNDLLRNGPERDPALLYEGGDIDRLHDVVTERLAPHRLTVLNGRRPNGRFRCLHEGEVMLYELGYGTDVTVCPGELGDFYNVQLPMSGAGVVTVDGVVLPSTQSIVGPGNRVSMTWNSEARNRILIIPGRAVAQALEVRGVDSSTAAVRFSPVLDEQDPLVRSWIELVRGFNEFVASPLSHRSPLGVRHFEQLLIDGLLDAQPHSRSDALTDSGSAALLPAVRRAKAFCEEHVHEPVSVADIALAARTSLRSLREGFRVHLNTTPLAYLRRLRLDHAHRDLLAIADGRADGTVTDVACRWGFTHLGRFSTVYRQTFGQPPSETLRRSC
ncbi:AraC family transcriptional regulator [Streptomyces sp. CBMA123]|uniref:AraC family transcriptional regulator n=1 Tax=Streptomyces sp. CBMA123 TaxID=1896313 RepID=UPI00294FFF91|nr:AraC family transcriptional regulator [Streptomyces sp. CBMA123]